MGNRQSVSYIHTGKVTLPGGWGVGGGGELVQLVRNIHTGMSNSHRGMERVGDEFVESTPCAAPGKTQVTFIQEG